MKTHWSNETSDWITAVEAGEILGMSESTVWRWGLLGRLPFRVEDTNVSFHRPSVLDWKRVRNLDAKAFPGWVVPLARDDESFVRSFRKTIEASHRDVIYQTRHAGDVVELVAFAKVSGEWVVVSKKACDRAAGRDHSSPKVGAK